MRKKCPWLALERISNSFSRSYLQIQVSHGYINSATLRGPRKIRGRIEKALDDFDHLKEPCPGRKESPRVFAGGHYLLCMRGVSA
jgi:hypothetical protein